METRKFDINSHKTIIPTIEIESTNILNLLWTIAGIKYRTRLVHIVGEQPELFKAVVECLRANKANKIHISSLGTSRALYLQDTDQPNTLLYIEDLEGSNTIKIFKCYSYTVTGINLNEKQLNDLLSYFNSIINNSHD